MAQIKWKTKTEIEDEKLIENMMPTQEEIEQAEFEIKVLTLLSEVELI